MGNQTETTHNLVQVKGTSLYGTEVIDPFEFVRTRSGIVFVSRSEFDISRR